MEGVRNLEQGSERKDRRKQSKPKRNKVQTTETMIPERSVQSRRYKRIENKLQKKVDAADPSEPNRYAMQRLAQVRSLREDTKGVIGRKTARKYTKRNQQIPLSLVQHNMAMKRGLDPNNPRKMKMHGKKHETKTSTAKKKAEHGNKCGIQ